MAIMVMEADVKNMSRDEKDSMKAEMERKGWTLKRKTGTVWYFEKKKEENPLSSDYYK
jgi:hypothetical protein